MRAPVTWLDVKLGLRMLRRYPGMSLAGMFAISVVIVCGAGVAVFDAIVNGTLPFEEGERVVVLENWDTAANEALPSGLHDLDDWRRSLATVDDIGAYRLVTRNVAGDDSPGEPVTIAEISAAAFRVARVPPLFGRYLVDGDETPGAPAVVVIGYDEWQQRFAGDPNVVGRLLTVGDTVTTVVGVMPDGFGFPVLEGHWLPLRFDVADYARGSGPELTVVGRLANGADLEAAQAELAVAGARAAADSPSTHARLVPRVLPYTEWFFQDMRNGETRIFQLIVLFLFAIIGANVAALVYARTAARHAEIAVRAALGASRWRIVTQLFVEGLVLSAAAAALGMLIAGVIHAQLDRVVARAPFWVDTSLTSGTAIGYVVALILIGAVLVGAIPALQATTAFAQAGLKQASATISRWKIGRTYGALIVVQVALAVAILPSAVAMTWGTIQQALVEPGFAAEEFLTAGLAMERDPAPGTSSAAADRAFAARFRDRQAELVRRLEAEPGVSDVTLLTRFGDNPRTVIELEGGGLHESGIGEIGADFAEVGVHYMDVFGIPMLAGRRFSAQDLDAPNRPILVNRSFAERVTGASAVGRRVRVLGVDGDGEPGPWLEIVGVVDDFPPAPPGTSDEEADLYHPVARGDARYLLLALRFDGAVAADVAVRLRELAAAVDPALQLYRVDTLDALLRARAAELRLVAFSVVLITLSVLALSATGFYALMSFTVTQRRREIGIRVALGGKPLRIMGSIMTRVFAELAIGIAIGGGLAVWFELGDPGELTGRMGFTVLPFVAAFVLLVGLAAAGTPALRGVRAQPTESLREE
jgi:putative ABC transport system permease protein